MKLGALRNALRTTALAAPPVPKAVETVPAGRLADELMGRWEEPDPNWPPNARTEVELKGRMSLVQGHLYYRSENELVKVIDVFDPGMTFGPVKVEWWERTKNGGRHRRIRREVLLEELYRVKHDIRCRTCGGDGRLTGPETSLDMGICHSCDGVGWVLSAKSVAPFKKGLPP
jgi:hypothetical protein